MTRKDALELAITVLVSSPEPATRIIGRERLDEAAMTLADILDEEAS